eukprot:TRINITY_DN11978_c0_g6_i1.p1 TRINITY_DN11978_c0_g6~~TRINITY_DN11978_c0_g6_i1.p1  ORF type:complete len:1338 (+),score=322.47 TRINITY_DN11978_c0_g6_i1:161-4174(+)
MNGIASDELPDFASVKLDTQFIENCLFTLRTKLDLLEQRYTGSRNRDSKGPACVVNGVPTAKFHNTQKVQANGGPGPFPEPGIGLSPPTPMIPTAGSHNNSRSLEGEESAPPGLMMNGVPVVDANGNLKEPHSRQTSTSASKPTDVVVTLEDTKGFALAKGVGPRRTQVALPGALQGRWKTERIRGTGSKMDTSASSQRVGKLKLDDRWREMLINNENEADSAKNIYRINYAIKIVEEKPAKAMKWSGGNSRKAEDFRMTLLSSEHLGNTTRLRLFLERFVHTVPIHPYSIGKLTWDVAGLLLVVSDSFNIPVQVAWELEPEAGSFGWCLTIFNLMFWIMDMFLNFNAGIFYEGNIVFNRWVITKRYMQTWLPFDVLLILLDVVLLSSNGSDLIFLRGARALRILRLARGLRLLKLRRLSEAFEELCTSHGQGTLILVFSVVKIMLGIAVLSHALGCAWFFLGRESLDAGNNSWIALVPHWKAGTLDHLEDQYLQSVSFVLGILLANVTDCTLGPTNPFERVFILLVIVVSMMVLGGAIGQMTNTFGELGRLNSEVSQTKTKLQRYLRASDVPMELSMRIIRFALHSLKRKLTSSLDEHVIELFSSQLNAELLVCQRSVYIFIHPLFLVINTAFPEVIHLICAAFESRMFADMEVAFTLDAWAEKMFFCAHGSWVLESFKRDSEESQHGHNGMGSTMSLSSVGAGRPSVQQSAKAKRMSISGRPLDPPSPAGDDNDSGMLNLAFENMCWFAEAALYVRYQHKSTLYATTFADAYTMTGFDFAKCLGNFPGAIGLVCRYAEIFLGSLWDGHDAPADKLPLADYLDKTFVMNLMKRLRQKRVSMQDAIGTSSKEAQDRVPWLHRVFRREMPLEQVASELEHVFCELNMTHGTYMEFGQKDEQKRSCSAMLAIIWLHYDSHEGFTASQPAASKMTEKQWEELREFYLWTGLDQDKFCAALVFLCIRGLGKVKIFAKALPPEKRTPEDVVLNLIHTKPHMVSSIFMLTPHMQALLESCFRIHSQFNLAQMLQGENTPNELAVLQTCLMEEGWDMLKFYTVCLFGIMSALRGAETHNGSLFMDARNGPNVMMGINCLRFVENVDPRAIYWSFVAQRAASINMTTENKEDLVLARVALLTRANAKDVLNIRRSWAHLSTTQRTVLMEHLLSDGLEEVAFVFGFLPLFFANAKNNKLIGLTRGMCLLADLIEAFREDGLDEGLKTGSVIIDIQDIANFAKEVKNARVFDMIPGQLTIHPHGSHKRAQISTKHWHRVDLTSWADDSAIDKDMAHFMRQCLRINQYNETYLEAIWRRMEGKTGGSAIDADAGAVSPVRWVAQRSNA